MQLYGDGTAELLHELKDGTIYPVAVTQDGASVSWTVSASDTATVGAGRAELRWYVGDTLAKSAKFRTSVSSALADSTTETPPEPQKSWVDTVLQAAQEIKDGAILDEKLAEAIAAYLEEHPIDAGLDETALAAYLVEKGYLTNTDLADAITQALAEAKASGEFDGAPGEAGADGSPGADGVTPKIQIGTVDTLPAGSPATASLTGTPENPLLNLGIPKGADGTGESITDEQVAQIAQNTADISSLSEETTHLKSDLDSKPQFGDPYDGIDLTVKHAEEIEDYASPWAWIKARIASGNFSQLHVGDYIPFTTTNGLTFQAKIAGINTYKGYGDSEVGNHIDFITRELWPVTFQMNLVNFNNGSTDTKQIPWLASNGYLFVNSLAGQAPNGKTLPLDMVDKDYTKGGMYFYLPDDLKSVIVEKRIYAPTRYSASGVLTNDNNAAWVNLGKLWLPDECEVTGARLMTTTGWSTGGYVQYPIFAGNMNRVKRYNAILSNWWLTSAYAGNSVTFVFVGYNGQVTSGNATSAFRAPFCFRI